MASEDIGLDAPGDNIAGKAFRGSVIGIGASAITLVLGFTRAILLARILAPEHFGVVALALFYIGLAARFRALGLDRAIIHRQDATQQDVGTYLTLRVGTVALSLVLLLAILYAVSRVSVPTFLAFDVLLALVAVDLVKGLGTIRETLLRKELAFRELAITDVVASAVMTIVAPLLAWRGAGVWALVAEQASGITVRFVLTWFVFGRWRPYVSWDRGAARWFLDYGRAAWGASSLAFVLDRFDDFWVGTVLGRTPLGYYSRSYEFARYPRRVIANPVVGVFSPIFAQLQDDRLRLSQAFYRAAHVILRSGFLIAGAFALVMPEFIALVIGERWSPMLLTFRLMLIYTLLDALLMLAGNLLMAVGQPQLLQRARLIQAAFFIPAVLIGARVWKINGVALAADGMLVVGTWVLYRQLRGIVDFSPIKLALWPLIALAVALGAGVWLEASAVPWGPWLMALGKLAVFTTVFLGVLGVAERGDYLRGLKWLWHRSRISARREGVR